MTRGARVIRTATVAGAAVALSTLVLALAAPPVRADELPPGRLIAIVGDGLVTIDLAGGDNAEATPFAELGVDPDKVTELAAPPSGAVVTLMRDGAGTWVRPPAPDAAAGASAPLHVVPTCVAPLSLSPDARCFVCGTADRTLLIQPLGGPPHTLALPSTAVQFLGPKGAEIVFVAKNAIWAASRRRPSKVRKLAPHTPADRLVIAPDGVRAAGRYEGPAPKAEDDRTAIHLEAFRLDGRATRRRLGGDAIPVTWSPDSQWLMSTTERATCIAHNAGGEYKCWDGYVGLGFSFDSTRVLLGERTDDGLLLFWAPLTGVKPVKARSLWHAPVRAAVWVR